MDERIPKGRHGDERFTKYHSLVPSFFLSELACTDGTQKSLSDLITWILGEDLETSLEILTADSLNFVTQDHYSLGTAPLSQNLGCALCESSFVFVQEHADEGRLEPGLVVCRDFL
jgi:hypothetical protein